MWKWKINVKMCVFVWVSKSLSKCVYACVCACAHPDSRTKGAWVYDKLLTVFISTLGPQSDSAEGGNKKREMKKMKARKKTHYGFSLKSYKRHWLVIIFCLSMWVCMCACVSPFQSIILVLSQHILTKTNKHRSGGVNKQTTVIFRRHSWPKRLIMCQRRGH